MWCPRQLLVGLVEVCDCGLTPFFSMMPFVFRARMEQCTLLCDVRCSMAAPRSAAVPLSFSVGLKYFNDSHMTVVDTKYRGT